MQLVGEIHSSFTPCYLVGDTRDVWRVQGQKSEAPTSLAGELESGGSLKATWQRSADHRRTCPAFLWMIITQKPTESMSCPRCWCCPYHIQKYCCFPQQFSFSDSLLTANLPSERLLQTVLSILSVPFLPQLNRKLNWSLVTGLPGAQPQNLSTWVELLQYISEQGEALAVLTVDFGLCVSLFNEFSNQSWGKSWSAVYLRSWAYF